ncbi:MAG: hypothetical protein GTO02_18130 [Candidatus Dadabacteria bacterium]|nr:hypothetical protein [Candidatus Dadabacteria bacterium]
MYLIAPESFFAMARAGMEVPQFATGQLKNYHAYRYFFVESYPAFVFLYPLSMFFMIKKFGKKGLYVLSSFLPLILMHSFVFGRKGARYIFYIYPFFVLGSVYVIDYITQYVVTLLKKEKDEKSRLKFIALCSALVIAINIFTYPWIKETVKYIDKPKNLDWKSVAHELKKIPKDSVLISTSMNAILYYGDRKPDYKLKMGSVKENSNHYIQSGSQLDRIIEAHEKVYFISDTRAFESPYVVDEDMRMLIRKKLRKLKHNGDGRILLFKKNGSIS